MSKINIEQIREELKLSNWVLLSDIYKNLDQELEYKCSEGHIVIGPWKKMREHLVCARCEQNQFKNFETSAIRKKGGVKRILALDQASNTTGWSIYDGSELIKFGTYTVPPREEIERFDYIKSWLVSMIANWKPDHVALEGIQYEQNFGVTVFQTLARLQGILMECCYEQHVEFTICPTNTWRNRTGVKGRSRIDRKRSAQLIIKDKYDVTATEDEADAILIGQYAANTLSANDIIEWE